MIRFSQLEDITSGSILQLKQDIEINYIITDSRKLIAHSETVFFAKRGPNHDGHKFLRELYKSGLRNFVVEEEVDLSEFKDANFIKVTSSVTALQQLARHHREELIKIKAIGITGSNGKTIVKEWLLQLLSNRHRIVATPHSYNSQLGVPISVWQANENHELGIFEAGISTTGEMEKLERIIQPDIGILTNIGPAHDEGFTSREEKLLEKLKLFINAETVIWCGDHSFIKEVVNKTKHNFTSYTWGSSAYNNIVIESKNIYQEGFKLLLKEDDDKYILTCGIADEASLENLMHCITLMRFLNYSWEEINSRIRWIKKVPMRLELKRGINNSYIVDDSYNNDLAGLEIALNFLSQQKQRQQKTAIISDIFQSGMDENKLYEEVNQLLVQKNISKVYAIGPVISRNTKEFTVPVEAFYKTDEFLKRMNPEDFHSQMILVKGARIFAFENIVNHLLEKIHGTRLEINLGAITHNLNFYRSRLNKKTKIMVMVKAFAYGTGIHEIANLLQYHNIDYLGAAYTDEGVNLRKNGVNVPIMIMNPSPEGYEQLLKFQLEPEIYGFDQLRSLLIFLNERELNVHLKIDTGMHRLGFMEEDIEQLSSLLDQNKNLKIKSVFSHLAAADDKSHEAYTHEQAKLFHEIYGRITQSLGYKPVKHILNSAGIINYPEYQHDMVRLGIGLYGVESSGLLQEKLQPISTLKTIISQIREVSEGKTIGYGRKGKAEKTKKIATIAIGYADGFSRFFSNGKGEVLVNGKRAPVIGNVCMDMTMIDVSGIDVQEEDDVIVFGEDPTINELAQRINTIPYEILTNVSERVKRIYLYE